MTNEYESRLEEAAQVIEQLMQRIDELESADGDAVAIVGMGCRIPGGVNTPGEFWSLLRNSVDATREIPSDRWDVDAYYDPDVNTPGRINTRRGGFLSEIDGFDATFFGISPREAVHLDPQQRLLLEVAWEALEHGGQVPESLRGSMTGVYVGISGFDYGYLMTGMMSSQIGAYLNSGTAHSTAAGRISYTLGLHGPAISVDTACSSSLVAIHLARQGLLAGESCLAIAGGVNVISYPETMVGLAQARMLAADGRCKTFSNAADGFARGEGCTVVILKRLSDARKDGDRIYAVIRGSAVNQDGASSGLTVPHGPSQSKLIETALRTAKLNPADVDYVEAHGTGTELGDPIEVTALDNVFGTARTKDDPLLIGSVKSNVGHLEAAAGATGLMKVVLGLYHGEIPPHLHFQEPNTRIPWERLAVRVPTKIEAWPERDRPRRAGVSAFGFSGTNAHVIVEEPPAQPESNGNGGAAHLLTLSARTPEALDQLAQRHCEALERANGVSLAQWCYTANALRNQFDRRAAFVVRSREDALTQLSDHVGTGEHNDPNQGVNRDRKVAFLFTGQGSQYAGMGKRLYETQPAFRDCMNACANVLDPLLEKPLLDIMFQDERSLSDTTYTQPALFALEMSLVALWRSWGVEPDAVLGHSVGEYAAVCTAGACTLEEGLRLIAERGRQIGRLPRGGGMAAIRAEEARLRALVDEFRGLSFAAFNGPNIVLSGPIESLNPALDRLDKDEIPYRRLETSHAFHSELMDPVLDEFEAYCANVTFSAPRIPLISNLTGLEFSPGDGPNGNYWRRHLREAVQFNSSVRRLSELGITDVVEIGPSSVLLNMARGCWPAPVKNTSWLASLNPNVPDDEVILGSLGKLYVSGVRVQFDRLNVPDGVKKTALPTYPFERQTYWFEDRQHRAPTDGPAGSALRSGEVMTLDTASEDLAYLHDHRVYGEPISPGALYVSLVSTLLRRGEVINGLVMGKAMPLESGGRRTIHVTCEPAAGSATSFEITSRVEDRNEQITHASGQIAPASADRPAPLPLETLQQLPAKPVDALYDGFVELGIEYRHAFQTVKRVCAGDGEVFGEVSLADGIEHAGANIHPSILDGCFQLVGAILDPEEKLACMPLEIQRVEQFDDVPNAVYCRLELVSGGVRERNVTMNVDVADADGAVVLRVTRLVCRFVTRETLYAQLMPSVSPLLYEVDWRERSDSDRHQPADFLLRNEPWQPVLQQDIDTFSAEGHAAGYGEGIVALDRVAESFLVDACGTLGWDGLVGKTYSSEDLRARLGVDSSYRPLWLRLQAVLESLGGLEADGAGLRVKALPKLDRLSMESFQKQHFGCRLEHELLDRCGQCLADILTKRQDPLPLLFAGSGEVSAENLYHEAPGSVVQNKLLGKAMRTLIALFPEDRAVRILEIGAGTGSATANVLPELPADRTEYVYTDVSPAFYSKAKERFNDYSFLDFATIDVERDPAESVVPEGAFDIVIAANVVHATKDVEQTLNHIKRFLTPGGALLIYEVVQKQTWLDLTFGLLEGWWRFNDSVRSDYALIPIPGWLDLLSNAGFVNAEALELDPSFKQSVFVANAPVSETRSTVAPGTWMVVSDGNPTLETLSSALTTQLTRCIRVTAADAFRRVDDDRFEAQLTDPDDVERLLSAIQEDAGELRGVVLGLGFAPEETQGIPDALLDTSMALVTVVQGLEAVRMYPSGGLWFVTRGAQPLGTTYESALAQSTQWGLAKAISGEFKRFPCRVVDLDPLAAPDNVERLVDELAHPPAESLVVYRRDVRYVPRLTPAASSTRLRLPRNEDYAVTTAQNGSLDQLMLMPIEPESPLPGMIRVSVRAAGLNFRDVLNALGALPKAETEAAMGVECVGVVTELGEGVTKFNVGDRVMGIALGAFRTTVCIHDRLATRIPDKLGFVEAASMPVVFVTAYCALIRHGKLHAGQRILIHAGAGGVGLAAIQVAQRIGAEIHVTASPPKWAFLRALGIENIYNSRTEAFAEEIREATGGRGVDLLVNCLSGGEYMVKSLDIVAEGGRFIEIGKRDVLSYEEAAKRRPGVNYQILSIIDHHKMLTQDFDETEEALEFVRNESEAGHIWPVYYQAFSSAEAPTAFRAMQRGRHIGKLVLTFPPTRAQRISDRRTYLVTGGLTGLGLATAEWLAKSGARHLMLVGRRAPSESAETTIARLRESGCHVVVEQADISKQEDVDRIFRLIDTNGPELAGVIHSAGTLHDAGLMNQSRQTFEKVFGPKVVGTWRLHKATLGRPLDFFILYSSVASVVGTPGQSNHVAANACMDLFAHYRRSHGLPCTSINWGAWGEIGAAANMPAGDRFAIWGVNAMTPREGILALDDSLAGDYTNAVALDADWEALRTYFDGKLTRAFTEDIVEQSNTFAPAAEAERAAELAHLIRSASTQEVRPILVDYLQDEVMRVLYLDSQVPSDRGFFDMGMDSLMAVEMRTHIEDALKPLELEEPVSSTALFDYPTIDKLSEYLCGLLTGGAPPSDGLDASAEHVAAPDDTPVPPESEADVKRGIEEAYAEFVEFNPDDVPAE